MSQFSFQEQEQINHIVVRIVFDTLMLEDLRWFTINFIRNVGVDFTM